MSRRPERARRRPRAGRWRALGVLGLVLGGVALGGTGAQAQDSGDASLASQFGGFALTGRANGLQLTYNVENVFPLPPPLLQVSVPESATSMQTGPVSTALGSVAYPGNLLANLPGIVGQASPEYASFVPPYPVRAEAGYPSGPAEANQSITTAGSTVSATASVAEALTTMGGADLPVFVRVGAITTTARSALLDGFVESRSRVEFAGVDLLFGLIHIDSIATDLVASSDGTVAASAGGTTITGATLLGQPIVIGPDGISAGEPSAPANPLFHCRGEDCTRWISVSAIEGGNPTALSEPDRFATSHRRCRDCSARFCDRCLEGTADCLACGGATYAPGVDEALATILDTARHSIPPPPLRARPLHAEPTGGGQVAAFLVAIGVACGVLVMLLS